MTSTALVLPSNITSDRVSALVSKKGNTYGSRIVFGSAVRATDVKAELKKADKSLKGSALTKRVNEVLTGKTTLAWAEHEVMVSAMRSAGYQPDSMDVRKSGGTVRFVKPAEPKADVSEAIAAKDAEIAALNAKLAELAAKVASL